MRRSKGQSENSLLAQELCLKCRARLVTTWYTAEGKYTAEGESTETKLFGINVGEWTALRGGFSDGEWPR